MNLHVNILALRNRKRTSMFLPFNSASSAPFPAARSPDSVAHVAAAWLGHSTLANKQYWQVTDEDFVKAVGAGAEAAQKAAQPAHAVGRGKSHEDLTAHKKAPVLLGSAAFGATLQN
jgi:hypothetical protein